MTIDQSQVRKSIHFTLTSNRLWFRAESTILMFEYLSEMTPQWWFVLMSEGICEKDWRTWLWGRQEKTPCLMGLEHRQIWYLFPFAASWPVPGLDLRYSQHHHLSPLSFPKIRRSLIYLRPNLYASHMCVKNPEI